MQETLSFATFINLELTPLSPFFSNLTYKLIFLIHQLYFSGQFIAIYFTSQSTYTTVPKMLMFIASIIISKISAFQLIPHTEAKIIYQQLSRLYDYSFWVMHLVATSIPWIKLLSTKLVAVSSQVPSAHFMCVCICVCMYVYVCVGSVLFQLVNYLHLVYPARGQLCPGTVVA